LDAKAQELFIEGIRQQRQSDGAEFVFSKSTYAGTEKEQQLFYI